ncbi:MAG TPA: hypothetical protein VF892_06265 [Pseudonocardiaceae bacterium]
MRLESGDGEPELATTDGAEGAYVHFAGDLFLALAADGRLVLDPVRADRVIVELERTIELVSAQFCRTELARRLPLAAVRELLPATELMTVDAAFIEQVSPGRFEHVLDELAKYVRAFKIAKAAGPGRPAVDLPPSGP